MLGALAASCAALLAASEPPATEMDLFNLEHQLEVSVLSATLSEQPIEATPAVVSVLTEDQIRVLGLQTLSEALRLMAGVTILHTQFGVTKIGIRGVASPAHVLITLDGHRLNGVYDGSLPADVSLHDIERIEVIRGPGSALYGGGAFSGVVSLYSRKRDLAEARAYGELLADHDVGGGVQAQGKLSRTSGNWRVRAAAAFADSSGPRVLVEDDTTIGAPYSQVPGDTHLPRRDLQLNLAVERRSLVSAADSLELWTALITERRGPYFGIYRTFAPDDSLTRADFVNHLDYRIQLFDNVRAQVRGLFDRREGSANVQDFPDGYTHQTGNQVTVYPEGKRRAYSYASYAAGVQPLVAWTTSKNQLTVGADVEHDWLPEFAYGQNYRNNVYAGPHLDNYDGLPLTQLGKDRTAVAGYAQDQLELGGFAFTAGLRYDHFSDSGGALSPRAAVVFRPLPPLAVKLLYGRAFRAPTLQELYDQTRTAFSDTGQDVAGNAALRPETTDTLELALEASPLQRLNLRLNGFYIRTDDAVAPEARFRVSGSQLINYPGLRVVGAEAEAQLLFGKGGYALVNASSFYSDQLGVGLPGYETDAGRRFLSVTMRDLPRGRANAAIVARPLEELRIGASYSFTSASDNNRRTVYEAINQYHRPMFHELALNGLYAVLPTLELSARAGAAIGRTAPVVLATGWYELPDGPRFSLLVGLRVHQ